MTVRISSLLYNFIDHDISDTVLHMMELASQIHDLAFSEEQIDGGVEGVCVSGDEDMLVAQCYIAECLTFNKVIDMETFNPNRERQRIVEAIMGLIRIEEDGIE